MDITFPIRQPQRILTGGELSCVCWACHVDVCGRVRLMMKMFGLLELYSHVASFCDRPGASVTNK